MTRTTPDGPGFSGSDAAAAGILMLSVNVACAAVGAALGALLGALVPLLLVGLFIGFGLGIFAVIQRFRSV